MKNKILILIIAFVVIGAIYSLFFNKKNEEVPISTDKQLIQVQLLNNNPIAEYPHDTTAYTEGLEFYKGQLYESAGEDGKSFITKYDANSTIKGFKKKIEDKKFFAEGITIINDTLYQLSYTNNIVTKYNAQTLQPFGTIPWKYGEGWGLTHDSTNLIASNGTSVIYFLNRNDLSLIRTINVNNNGTALIKINELEYVDGFIYANQFMTDNILKINAANGNVVATNIFTNLVPKYNADVLDTTNMQQYLNGIAYNSTTKTFYITGKNWPKMFEFKF